MTGAPISPGHKSSQNAAQRRSQSFGGKSSIVGMSLGGTTNNLGFCKNLGKMDLLHKLHETLCEKDKLNEKMTLAVREKLISESSMV